MLRLHTLLALLIVIAHQPGGRKAHDDATAIGRQFAERGFGRMTLHALDLPTTSPSKIVAPLANIAIRAAKLGIRPEKRDGHELLHQGVSRIRRVGAHAEAPFTPYFADVGSGGTVGSSVNALAEAESVRRFLASASRQPSALLIEGEAGIGKTHLWLAAHDAAHCAGFRVLSTRASESESLLDFVGLNDLVGDVESEVLERLPETQRSEIERVLMRGGGPAAGVDLRSIAAAFTAIVDGLAAHTPVLLAIDDCQWLDAATRETLAYAVRRLRNPVGILVTERSTSDRVSAASWLDLGTADSVVRMQIGPMSLGRLHRLTSSRTGRFFPRPTIARIAEISGGNPFYALELAHMVDSSTSMAEPMLPATLIDAVRLQFGHFDEEVQQVLLAAACVAQPTVDVMAAVVQKSAERVLALLEEPENRGIVVIDGSRLRFSHPLLAHSVYSQARAADRRRVHRAIAVVEPVLERQARHLALAATTADPETLLVLDSAAEAAGAKGAPTIAAELLELAIGLGGDTPSRRMSAAHNHLLAGDIDRAITLVKPTEAALPAGPFRARARMLLGGALTFRGSYEEAVDLLHSALSDAVDDPALTVSGHLSLALALSAVGDAEGSERHVHLARTRAEDSADTRSISQALAMQVLLRCMNGYGIDEVSLRRAIELERSDDTGPDGPVMFSARIVKALILSWTGRLTEAHDRLSDAQRSCAASGRDIDMLWIQLHSAMADIWRGRYDDAAQIAEDMLLGAEQLGGLSARVTAAVPRSLIAAYTGRETDARAEIALALDGGGELVATSLCDWPRMALGFLELSLGNHAAALEALEPLLSQREVGGSTEILSCWFLPDALEAAFALGRFDEFEEWVDALETNGARLNRPWMIAVGGRCRSILLAARGDIGAAEEAGLRAMQAHDALEMPFERARTQLVIGQLQRRQRRKQAARDTLADALTTFETLGAPLWADRARAELSRANVGRTQHGLTPSEWRVAELVASGKTNKDVAAAMYISPKTVEHNLGCIYRKLGIRNRAELGRQIDALREGPG